MYEPPIHHSSPPLPDTLRRRNGQCLKTIDFLFNDILMVLFSLSDIFLDILVCRQFYKNNQMEFFYASLSIFIFAQCCYSFLFTLHWGKDYTAPQQCIVFFAVLPFGQFVPFLSWIESFEFEWVNSMFDFLHLHSRGGQSEAASREFEEAGGDLLYDYIQKKFYSHGGFLVEALAEAIPQSILQTIAVLYFGEASILFIVSIFVSICVISSKGYLISYSMHRPTFVFNLLCVFADVLCMFATVSWLFSNDDEDNDVVFDAHDGVKATWMSLYCGASVLMVLSSGCFVSFVTLDRHHEMDIGLRDNSYGGMFIMLIELYIAHFLGWFFSLVPMCVALMTFKFIYFPISIQNQDECMEFARYKTFYSALHEFVLREKSDLKLYITNKFLLHCRGNIHMLSSALSGKYTMSAKKQAVHEWLTTTVGPSMHGSIGMQKLSTRAADLYKSFQSSDPQSARVTVRKYNTESEIQFFGDQSISERLSAEFPIFKTFIHSRDNFPKYKEPGAFLRYCIALFLASVGLPSFFLFVPLALLFLLYSWFYPIVELVVALVQYELSLNSIPILPLCLTLAYLFVVILMFCLAPNIYKFNRLCIDIVPLSYAGFPPPFFDVAVVKELEAAYDAELSWQHLDEVFDTIFGMDVTLMIKSYCSTGCPNIGGLYGSKNMLTMMSNRQSVATPKGTARSNSD